MIADDCEISESSSSNISSESNLSHSEFLLPLMTSPFNEAEGVNFGGNQTENVGTQLAVEGIRQALAGINEMHQCIVPQNQSEEEKERVGVAMQTAANGISLALSGIDAMTEELTAPGLYRSLPHPPNSPVEAGGDRSDPLEEVGEDPATVMHDFLHRKGYMLLLLVCLAVLTFVTLCATVLILFMSVSGLCLCATWWVFG